MNDDSTRQRNWINPLIVEQCKPNKSATSIWL